MRCLRQCGQCCGSVLWIGGQVDRGDSDERGPATGKPLDTGDLGVRKVQVVLIEQARGQQFVECEFAGAEPGEPAGQIEGMPSQRRIEASGDDRGEMRGAIHDEIFQSRQGERVGQQMGVVEDQYGRLDPLFQSIDQPCRFGQRCGEIRIGRHRAG